MEALDCVREMLLTYQVYLTLITYNVEVSL